MVIRQIKESRWKHVYSSITRYGRAAPLSLQYDVDINCNGVDYILKLQPGSDRKLTALQALGVYPDGGGCKDFLLVDDNAVLSALLEIIIYQGADKRGH